MTETELNPLRSVYTESLPNILQQLGLSLFVSTYQAGKLVVLRADEGKLNTHFRQFEQPMGIAVNQHHLAIGTAREIGIFHNVPAVTAKLEPPGKHDACYLPRKAHITGNIFIHEMAFGEGELWFVNTRFSCLCTLDTSNSFVPRWRPPFVTALSPEDRCHLNGMAMFNGKPRCVTAHGSSNDAQGWREKKVNGGIVMDVANGEIVASGLSMPHSPRIYGGKLWVLNSGFGSVGTVDLDTGKYEEFARLPGFTRGLDFYGNFAFIGLSQVRETAVFSGIPIAEEEERSCGVWVLNIHTGETVAYVRFEDALQEVFAVNILPNIRYPEVINDNPELIGDSFVLPDEALEDVPKSLLTEVEEMVS